MKVARLIEDLYGEPRLLELTDSLNDDALLGKPVAALNQADGDILGIHLPELNGASTSEILDGWKAHASSSRLSATLDEWGTLTLDIEIPHLPDGLRLYQEGDLLGGYVPPEPDQAIYQGPIGDWLETVAKETEASVAALGLAALCGLGAWYGRQYRLTIGRLEHRTNLFGVVVGPTATARKTTAEDEAIRLIREVDTQPGPTFTTPSSFLKHQVVSGFGSGEGILKVISDPEYDEEGNVISGTLDQRLLIRESEFASVLRIADRMGSTLVDILRNAFDGKVLSNRTVQHSRTATSHCVSLFGGITPGELMLLFSSVKATSGVGNRILWAWSDPDKELPFGGKDVDTSVSVDRLRRRPERLTYELTGEAEEWWEAHYSSLRNLPEIPERLKPMMTRSMGQVLRIALIQSVSEGADSVAPRHLEAGLAWVHYSQATVQAALGGLVRDEVAGKVLQSLHRHPGQAVKRTDLHDGPLQRHHTAAELEGALKELDRAGLIHRWTAESGGGRPPEMIVATIPTRGLTSLAPLSEATR